VEVRPSSKSWIAERWGKLKWSGRCGGGKKGNASRKPFLLEKRTIPGVKNFDEGDMTWFSVKRG